jgi:murein DD-endopeptidase MepM/ murein hydrolase activator NlpD
MSSESEMTKETLSGYTPLSIFYRCPRLMQGLSLVSGLGLISSGLVAAQAESPTDTGSVPKKSAMAPAVVHNSRKAADLQREAAPPKKPLATVSTKPMTPESLVMPNAPMRQPALELAPYVAKKPTTQTRASVPSAAKKPASSEASRTAITVTKKPALRGPNLYVPNSETAAKPSKLYINPAQVRETAKIPFSPTNTAIDRSNYSIGVTRRYDGPSAVVLTERSTGCQTTSQNGQLLSGVCGFTPPRPKVPSQQTADSGGKLPSQQIASSGRTLPGLQVASSGRTLPGLQIASSGRTLPVLKITKSENTLPSPLTKSENTLPSPQSPNSERTVPNLETTNFQPNLQEPQLVKVQRLPTPPVARQQFVKINPLKAGMSVIRATEQAPSPASYGAGIPLTSPNLPDDSTGASTTSTGLDYYYLTARPAGRPNIGKETFMFPLTIPAPITSLFGWRIHPITEDRRFHAGTDLGAPIGTPVLAAVAGQVITADFLGGYGLTVVLQHGQGLDESLYGHLSEIFVQPGDQVEQGSVIGRVGNTGNSTGPHLHFEWRHLTPGGWVAVDAGAHLEYALAQFIRVLQVAQADPQRGV